ncbi:MAG: CHASE2 domain-containing protein, partial [Cyanobacteria bacterium J06642_11]
LNFPTDEFFALIRHCYEKRATNTNYKRLTFVLLGVATPSDLMRSKQFSPPFNIGRAISLQGFHIDDCAPLIQGLSPYVNAPKPVLEEILYWSGGQPFLTQKLCWLITQYANDAGSPVALEQPMPTVKTVRDWFKHFVSTYIIQNWEASDEPEHLRTIRDRLLREGIANLKVLLTYREILHIGHIPSRDKPEHLKLRLSGIVDVYQGQLRVKNSIYATIFNQYWVDQEINNIPEAVSPPLKAADLEEGSTLQDIETLQLDHATFSSAGSPPKREGIFAYLATLSMGIGITVIVVVASLLGMFEGLELKAFDYLMRARPGEGPDPRFLLVTITEADVQAQPIEERGAASLSDQSLMQLLTILQRGRPRVIGLDMYRQRQVDERYPALVEQLANNDRLFGICYYSDPGVPPPPEMGDYQHGFNNVIQDVDGILRRQILAVSSPAPCNNGYSLNWWLATRYLQQEDIEPGVQDNYLQLGTLPLKRIQSNTSGY